MAFVIGLVEFVLLVSPLGGWPALAVAIGAAVLFYQTIGKARREARERRRRQHEERVRGIVQTHLPALLRRKRQLDRTDDYGVRDDGKWVKEINRFCDTVVCPAIGQIPLQMPRGMKSQPRRSELDNLIAALIDQAVTEQASSFAQRFDPGMTPTDYEHFCADRLKLSGWTPMVTKAAGDQGADIVATRAGRTLVVQCKHHAKAVGNKAVQEVAAAMRHYSAEAGVVVATNGFTRAAEQLAASNGIILLGHDDLTPGWTLADNFEKR